MIKKGTFTVKPADERPARLDGTCFYCGQPIGSQHKEDCVIPQKTCVIDFTIRMVTTEPAYWTSDQIEFHYNHGSWCGDNLISMIKQYRENTGNCLCNLLTAKFVKEADKADEQEFGYDPSKWEED